MILPALSIGGVERVVINLSEYFSKNGHEVHIIIFNNIQDFKLNNNIYLHVLKKKNSKELKSLINFIEKDNKKFDYIYSHFLGNLIKKANLDNRYYIFHSAISQKLNKGFFLSRFIRKIRLKYRYNNENIITVSDGIKEDFLKLGFKPKSIHTIYNPFDFEYIKHQAEKIDDSIPNEEYIVHVARFDEVKRHDILLKSFSKAQLSCKLILVGEGSKEKTQNIITLINQLKLEKQVIMVGNKKNPFPLIKNAKLLILSSDFEGFGMVLVEALILNTPIVSTNCKSGPSEIMKGNLANYLVPTRDVDSLALKMYDTYHNPPLINQNDLKRFDTDIIGKKYLSLKEKN